VDKDGPGGRGEKKLGGAAASPCPPTSRAYACSYKKKTCSLYSALTANI